MNPCGKNKKRIAWMVSGGLDTTQAEALGEHFKICPGCRLYWQDLSELTIRLQHAADLPQAEATESFHRKVVRKISRQKSPSPFSEWATALQRFWPKQRLTILVVGAAFGIAAILLIHHFNLEQRPAPVRLSSAVAQKASMSRASSSTLASYRRVADISIESLDDLLTQQAARASSPGETLTVSSSMKTALEN